MNNNHDPNIKVCWICDDLFIPSANINTVDTCSKCEVLLRELLVPDDTQPYTPTRLSFRGWVWLAILLAHIVIFMFIIKYLIEG